jgi:hypothetical protein
MKAPVPLGKIVNDGATKPARPPMTLGNMRKLGVRNFGRILLE